LVTVTGTMVNYFFHCKRQCWLFANRVNLEDNSEDVHIGRVMHEIRKEEGKNDSEIAIESIKVDSISDEYVTEIKKSDADITAAKWQLIFYLKILKDKGIERKGRLEVAEKNKQSKKYHTYELTTDLEKELEEVISNVEKLVISQQVPLVERNNKCKKCAYYEYCIL